MRINYLYSKQKNTIDLFENTVEKNVIRSCNGIFLPSIQFVKSRNMFNRSIQSISILLMLFILSACFSKKNEAWLLSELSNFENIIENNDAFILSEDILEKRLTNLVKAKKDLELVKFEELTDSSKGIYKDIQKRINRELYLQDTLDVYHWNATMYRFTPLMQKRLKNGKTEEAGFEAANELLALADSFYSVAKENISKAISIEQGKLAVEEHRADYLFLQNEFPTTLEASSISKDLKNEIGEQVQNLQLQIKDYIGYVMSAVNNIDDLDNKRLVVDEGDDLKKYSE